MKLHTALIPVAFLFSVDVVAHEFKSSKAKVVYDAALKNPDYRVDWSNFDFKDPEDDQAASEVAYNLDSDFSAIISALSQAKDLISKQRNSTETTSYKDLEALYQRYTRIQSKTANDHSTAFISH